MFVLRRVTSEVNEVNICLNGSYNLIVKETNIEEFKMAALAFTDQRSDCENEAWIYAFIVYNDGKSVIPLYKASSYFIMTGQGETFANITFKK